MDHSPPCLGDEVIRFHYRIFFYRWQMSAGKIQHPLWSIRSTSPVQRAKFRILYDGSPYFPTAGFLLVMHLEILCAFLPCIWPFFCSLSRAGSAIVEWLIVLSKILSSEKSLSPQPILTESVWPTETKPGRNGELCFFASRSLQHVDFFTGLHNF